MDIESIRSLFVHFKLTERNIPDQIGQQDHSLVTTTKGGDFSAYLILVGRNIDWVMKMMVDYASGNNKVGLNLTVNTFLALWDFRLNVPPKYELPGSKFRYHIFDFTMWYYGIDYEKDKHSNSLDGYFEN